MVIDQVQLTYSQNKLTGKIMSISLTEAAVQIIKIALGERGKGIGIRLRETDLCFKQDGVLVITDMKNLVYTEGLLLDYSESGGERGFSVSHAEPCHECGCSS